MNLLLALLLGFVSPNFDSVDEPAVINHLVQSNHTLLAMTEPYGLYLAPPDDLVSGLPQTLIIDRPLLGVQLMHYPHDWLDPPVDYVDGS